MSKRYIGALLFSLIIFVQSKDSAFIKKRVIGNLPGDKNKTARVIGAEKPIVDASDEQLSTVEAGLVATLTSKFFEDYNKFILDVF